MTHTHRARQQAHRTRVPSFGRTLPDWVTGEANATALLRMDDAAFGRELTRRYRGRLGAMRPVGGRHAVPVVTAYAARFVGRRFALLGDASSSAGFATWGQTGHSRPCLAAVAVHPSHAAHLRQPRTRISASGEVKAAETQASSTGPGLPGCVV